MNPVLYILMRNDLNSMNPGKMAAQASHASNAFVKHFHYMSSEFNVDPNTKTLYNDIHKGFYIWENSTPQGFGTVLVLEGNMTDISFTTNLFLKNNYVAGIIHDPTYPIVDGNSVHYIPLDTCSYIFIHDKNDDEFAYKLLSNYSLHK